ncbi:MAG TPA: hypothetical protein DCE80_16240, partial [Ignavibacteriales bacterium]|nr:hypothetical protein [Ignavibacteriales bacterium]
MSLVLHSKINFLKLTLLFLLLVATINFAQTKSRIVGTVKDAETKEPLIGVNLLLLDTYLGASTDINGKYFIVNVPIGTYTCQVSMVGYTKKKIVDVRVSADRVTTLDIELSATTIQGQEVLVVAPRNELHKEVSSTQLVVTAEQLNNAAGIREVNTFLENQPGISSSNGFLEIRGGSADQTGVMINGFGYNNAAVGNAEASAPLSSIEQISLLSGGYTAEYGNFRSGLINITTKTGSKSEYHGTINISKNTAHLKRFGPEFTDVHSPALAPFLDPRVAFVGTAVAWKDDPYQLQQHETFSGWNKQASNFNIGKPIEKQATPLDLYLLAAWMHMAKPDYDALAEQGYTVSDEQKKLIADHAMKETGTDYNIDAGFGGPVPFVSKYLGDATFYISNNSKEKYYIMPVSSRSEKFYNTLATIKSTPVKSLTILLNGSWKRQLGVSPIRPAFADSPDASREGGFMPIDNVKYFIKTPDQWYDPPLFPLLDQTTLAGGIQLNHVLNDNTFWELSLGYSSIKDHSPTGDNRNNTVLTHFGPFPVSEMPYGKWQFAPNNRLVGIFGKDTISYTYPGYDALPGLSRRFRSKEGDLYTNVHTQQSSAKFSINSQYGEHHYFKAGLEYNLIDIDHNFWEKWNTNAYNTYEFNYHRKPSQTGAYVQDQISYEGIIANVGLRMDYFYGGGGKWPTGDPFSTDAFVNVPYRDLSSGAAADSFYQKLSEGRSLIWEWWEEYDKTHPGFLQPIKNYMTFSPRVGIAFPVTENSKFYFNYGHYRSNPPYYSMYLVTFRYTKNGLYELSNPNLEPPKTISYELGLSYNFYENILLSISGYSKDVTGQQGTVTYTNAKGTINYDSWENNNYQDIQGIELNIKKNDNSWITGWLNFDYMLKKSGLTGRETVNDITVNNDKYGLYAGQESRFLPQPRLSANITLRSPSEMFHNEWLKHLTSDWDFTILAKYSAGSYYTWNPLSKDHVSSNLQFPDYYMVDLRLSKSFNISGLNTTFFVDVSNVFNIKVNLLSKGYAFNKAAGDDVNYFASLHLPMYNSSEFDDLRAKNPGLYVGGNDKVGDLRSSDKPYINDPNYSYWIYGNPRDIWFG